MSVSIDELHTWMNAREDEHLEFKEAKTRFDFEKLVKYCVALANEGGGRMILGVTDRPPRTVVGSRAFRDLERTKAGLIERLRLRLDIEELQHPDGRVLVFQVPSRPLGVPLADQGAYWMRGGESLVPMTPDQLQRIFAGTGPDFSAEICTPARLDDLDPVAVEILRQLWQRKLPDQDISTRSVEQLLTDAELLVDGGVTYAALVLLGTRKALGNISPRRSSYSSTAPTTCRDRRRNAGSSDRVSCPCSTPSGDSSTSAMTGSTSSKASLSGTCPPSTNAWFARPS